VKEVPLLTQRQEGEEGGEKGRGKETWNARSTRKRIGARVPAGELRSRLDLLLP